MQLASSFFPVFSLPDDKLHDHCGVFAVYGHPEASKLAYLGLYALQHRGQESAGICVSDGESLTCKRGMGHVDEVFPPEVIRPCLDIWRLGTPATPRRVTRTLRTPNP